MALPPVAHHHRQPGPIADRAAAPAVPSEAAQRRQRSPFWRHFWQMLAVMGAGMLVAGAIFLAVVGAKTWEEVTTQYPTQCLLAMAAGMTVPMVAWMRYRGMSSRTSYEMGAVMVLAALPFLLLVWFDVTKSAQCGGYCLLSVAAMLALMRYRRDEYSTTTMGAHSR